MLGDRTAGQRNRRNMQALIRWSDTSCRFRSSHRSLRLAKTSFNSLETEKYKISTLISTLKSRCCGSSRFKDKKSNLYIMRDTNLGKKQEEFMILNHTISQYISKLVC